MDGRRSQSCAVPIRILAGRRASSRKTGEIPPVKETSASLQELKGPGQVRTGSHWSMQMPL